MKKNSIHIKIPIQKYLFYEESQLPTLYIYGTKDNSYCPEKNNSSICYNELVKTINKFNKFQLSKYIYEW